MAQTCLRSQLSMSYGSCHQFHRFSRNELWPRPAGLSSWSQVGGTSEDGSALSGAELRDSGVRGGFLVFSPS